MKTCIITGASRGIGKAIALRLAASGSHLYLLGRDQKALESIRRQIEKRGARGTILMCDLAQTDSLKKLCEKIDAPRIDLLVNNAGMAVVKPFEQLTLDDWNRTFAVNVTAPFFLLKQMSSKLSNGASVVNIISTAARTGFPEWSSYCMSKFALDGFARSVREELRPRNIRVINIYPAAIDTDIWNNIPGEWPRDKMMSPDEVAAAVEFALARPASVMVEDITIGNSGGSL